MEVQVLSSSKDLVDEQLVVVFAQSGYQSHYCEKGDNHSIYFIKCWVIKRDNSCNMIKSVCYVVNMSYFINKFIIIIWHVCMDECSYYAPGKKPDFLFLFNTFLPKIFTCNGSYKT